MLEQRQTMKEQIMVLRFSLRILNFKLFAVWRISGPDANGVEWIFDEIGRHHRKLVKLGTSILMLPATKNEYNGFQYRNRGCRSGSAAGIME